MKPDETKPHEEPAQDRKPAPETRQERHEGEPTEPRSRYEFKILPADPKNAFDFEDVADK